MCLSPPPRIRYHNVKFDTNGNLHMRNLRYASIWQRRLVFFLIFGGILMALVAVTWLLANQALNGGERVTAYAFAPNATLTEFAVLPDDDAYPAAVAAATDGTVYTGSFATGAIWSITPDGVVTEVPGSRDAVGALTGLAVAPDGSLLVVDQNDTDPRSSGGKVLRLQDGTATTFADVGFVAPNDITLDSAGHVYVSDSGSNQVWRFDADGIERRRLVDAADTVSRRAAPRHHRAGIRSAARRHRHHRPGTERHFPRQPSPTAPPN